jgi:hypothetical protein
LLLSRLAFADTLKGVTLAGVTDGGPPVTSPATFSFIPNTGTNGRSSASLTVAQTANRVSCVSFVADTSLSGITKVAAISSNGGSSSHHCGICIYKADGTQLLFDGGGMSCTGSSSTVMTKTGVAAFSMQAGTKYIECWTTDDAAALWVGDRRFFAPVRNAFSTVEDGTAAGTGTSGSCPSAPLGTLTAFSGGDCQTSGLTGTLCLVITPIAILSAE